MDDIDDIMKELQSVLARNLRIGLRLHLKSVTLEMITEHNSEAAQAMKAVIIEWLNKNYNTARFGPPTWKALVAAVASNFGGNSKAEAERIASKHKAGEFL